MCRCRPHRARDERGDRDEAIGGIDLETAQDEVPFARKTGFMCKTTATDEARLRELVALAWIPIEGVAKPLSTLWRRGATIPSGASCCGSCRPLYSVRRGVPD